MRDFYANNLHLIRPGLRLYRDDPSLAIEFPCGRRRADILAVDQDGTLFVIEVKRKTAAASAIGQLTGYMQWVRAFMTDKVQGVLVAQVVNTWEREFLASLSDVSVFEYLPDKSLVRLDP